MKIHSLVLSGGFAMMATFALGGCLGPYYRGFGAAVYIPPPVQIVSPAMAYRQPAYYAPSVMYPQPYYQQYRSPYYQPPVIYAPPRLMGPPGGFGGGCHYGWSGGRRWKKCTSAPAPSAASR